jgi:hypothetical protein
VYLKRVEMTHIMQLKTAKKASRWLTRGLIGHGTGVLLQIFNRSARSFDCSNDSAVSSGTSCILFEDSSRFLFVAFQTAINFTSVQPYYSLPTVSVPKEWQSCNSHQREQDRLPISCKFLPSSWRLCSGSYLPIHERSRG